jgi:membrane associated rhomboid family serine protease
MFIPLKDRNRTRTFPYVTIALIILNIWIFILQAPFGSESVTLNLTYRFGFIPGLFVRQFDRAEYARAWERLKLDFMRQPTESRGFFERMRELQERHRLVLELDRIERSHKRVEVLTLLTCMFLHGSLWHVLANMLFLWVFGNNIEDAAGHGKFLLFYVVCGAVGSFAQMAVSSESLVPMIGASGAISGVMGAYMLLYPQARIVTIIPVFYYLWYPVEIPAYLYLGYWIIVQILLGLVVAGQGGVAWFAHVGGFFAGLLLIFLFKKRHGPVENSLLDG